MMPTRWEPSSFVPTHAEILAEVDAALGREDTYPLTEIPRFVRELREAAVVLVEELVEVRSHQLGSAHDIEVVAQAMQDAWEEWIADTGSIPDAFKIHGPLTTRVSVDFHYGNFAEHVADRIAAAQKNPS